MPRQELLEDFYIYQVDFGTILAGGTATQNINIQADSNFRWEQGVFSSNYSNGLTGITVSTQVFPFATILMTDTGSGRQLMSGAVPIPNLFGSAGLPFILQKPRIFVARATIALTVTVYDTIAGPNGLQLRLSFIGSKMFQTG